MNPGSKRDFEMIMEEARNRAAQGDPLWPDDPFRETGVDPHEMAGRVTESCTPALPFRRKNQKLVEG